MSDTPRTDAAVDMFYDAVDYDGVSIHEKVSAEDMRQLERELAEAKRTIAWLRACPLPEEPFPVPAFGSLRHEWNRLVEHYESHLQSNPPEGWQP